MIKKIKYGSFTAKDWNKITITNSLDQNWELNRVGISESEVKQFLKDNGKTEGVKTLIGEGKLIPVYGGELNIENEPEK